MCDSVSCNSSQQTCRSLAALRTQCWVILPALRWNHESPVQPDKQNPHFWSLGFLENISSIAFCKSPSCLILSGIKLHPKQNTNLVQEPVKALTLFVWFSSSFGQIDNRHPLVQSPTVSAESIQFAEGWILPRGWLWILWKKREKL